MGRKCGECELGLQGLCKAAERGKVITGRKKKEELVIKNEDGATAKQVEVSESVDVKDGILDRGDGSLDKKPQTYPIAGDDDG